MLYQLSYTPDFLIRVGAEKKRKEGPDPLIISQRRGSIRGSYCGESFPLIEDSIYKRRSVNGGYYIK